MKFRLTKSERSWLGIFGVLGLVVFAVLLVQSLTGSKWRSLTSSKQEPLADPTAINELLLGHTLPRPADIQYAQFHKVHVNPIPLSSLAPPRQILGVNSLEKHIEVDISNQKVYAFEGGNIVHEFVVSTGKWGRTPVGEFRIWAKVRSQKMEGGDPANGTYYYLPNVPYVMFFYNNDVSKSMGFSFHGTYWHNNFGHPMSHGCINMRISEAQTLYEWATPTITNDKAWSTLADTKNPGTRVVIYGETPRE